MAFLVAPGGDLDRAVEGAIGIEHARGLERVDDAERAVEPAGIVLAFEMRTRKQLWAGLGTGADDIADTVDCGGKACLGQSRAKPFQRTHMSVGEGRLVHAALVGAERPQCVEVGKDAGAVGAQVII